MQDDHDWSSFVYWVVGGTIYAEENGTDVETSNDMPICNVFGPDLLRMFRDSIYTVGSYGKMYERSFQQFHPRGGRNMLNQVPNDGSQIYSISPLVLCRDLLPKDSQMSSRMDKDVTAWL